MKRQWIYLLCSLVVAAGVAFVACDDKNQTSNFATSFERMEMIFSYAVSDDLLAVADVLISYTDPAGESTTPEAPLSVTEWSKIFMANELPATAVVEVQVLLKDGLTLDRDSYTLTQRWSSEFKEIRSDGKVHWHEAPDVEEQTETFTLNPSDPDALLAQITEAVNLMNRTFRYTVAADSDGTGYEVTDNAEL